MLPLAKAFWTYSQSKTAARECIKYLPISTSLFLCILWLILCSIPVAQVKQGGTGTTAWLRKLWNPPKTFPMNLFTFRRWTGSLVEGDSIVNGWKRSILEWLNRFQARVERGPTLCETRDKCIKVFSYWTHLLCHLTLMHVIFLIMWVFPCIRHLILS